MVILSNFKLNNVNVIASGNTSSGYTHCSFNCNTVTYQTTENVNFRNCHVIYDTFTLLQIASNNYNFSSCPIEGNNISFTGLGNFNFINCDLNTNNLTCDNMTTSGNGGMSLTNTKYRKMEL